jgi:hypothetical protein
MQFLAFYLILLRLAPREAGAERGGHDWEAIRDVLRSTLRDAARVDMNEWSNLARANIEAHAGPLSGCDWSAKQVQKKAVEGKCKYEPVVSAQTRLHVKPPSQVFAFLNFPDSDVNLMDDKVIAAINTSNSFVRATFVSSPLLEVRALTLRYP